MSWYVEETDERVIEGKVDFVSRFRWRADRACRRLNAQRYKFWGDVPQLYRFEVVREDGRWAVVAFQNRAVPPPRSPTY